MNFARGRALTSATTMNRSDKIFIAGATGMVGSALVRTLSENGYTNVIGSYHSRPPQNAHIKFVQMDLRRQEQVNVFFRDEAPDYVFLAAARVGGIHANHIYPADFIYDNMMIQSNIIHAAYENRVQRLLFLGSSCIYPQKAPSPWRRNTCYPAHWNPPMNPTPLQKSPESKCVSPITASMGPVFLR